MHYHSGYVCTCNCFRAVEHRFWMLPLCSRVRIFNRLIDTIRIVSTSKHRAVRRPQCPFETSTFKRNSSPGVIATFTRMAAQCCNDGFVRLNEEEKKKFDVKISVKAIKIPKKDCNKYLKGMNKYVYSLWFCKPTSRYNA